MKQLLRGWKVVIASALGLLVSPGPVAFYSIGVLMGPLRAAHGWSTEQISLLPTILTISIIAGMLPIGTAIDRIGPKRVLLPALLAYGMSLAMAGYMESLWGLYFAYALIGVCCAGANSVPYMRAISAWFDRHRGLAVGVASTGMGAGFALVPAFTSWCVRRGGTTGAYWGLAALILLIGVPAVAFWFSDGPGSGERQLAKGLSTVSMRDQEAGATCSQALRMRQFWILMIMFASSSGCIYGAAIHLIPVLQHSRTTESLAVFAAGMFGASAMIGRVIAGLLCDKTFPPYVACSVFVAGSAGMAVLGLGDTGFSSIASAILIGFCSGAEGDILAILCSRYFGQRSFGRIYGYVFAAALVGISIVPYAIGAGFEHFQEYRIPMLLISLALCGSGLAALTLGEYPLFDDSGLVRCIPQSPSDLRA